MDPPINVFFSVCPGHPRAEAKGPICGCSLRVSEARPPLWPLPPSSSLLPFSLFCVLSALHRVVVTRSVCKACEIVFRHSHNHTCPLEASGSATCVPGTCLLAPLFIFCRSGPRKRRLILSYSDSFFSNERKGGLGANEGERGSERASGLTWVSPVCPFVSLFVCRSSKLSVSIHSSSCNLLVSCAVCSVGPYFVVLGSVVSGLVRFGGDFQVWSM